MKYAFVLNIFDTVNTSQPIVNDLYPWTVSYSLQEYTFSDDI